MKKRDLWIILGVLIVGLVGVLFINLNKGNEAQTLLRVTSKGEVYKEIPLTAATNESFNVETDLGLNKIKIENGVVRIYKADCPDQICVHNAPIDEISEMIVCLPNQVIAEIVANK